MICCRTAVPHRCAAWSFNHTTPKRHERYQACGHPHCCFNSSWNRKNGHAICSSVSTRILSSRFRSSGSVNRSPPRSLKLADRTARLIRVLLVTHCNSHSGCLYGWHEALVRNGNAAQYPYLCLNFLLDEASAVESMRDIKLNSR